MHVPTRFGERQYLVWKDAGAKAYEQINIQGCKMALYRLPLRRFKVLENSYVWPVARG